MIGIFGDNLGEGNCESKIVSRQWGDNYRHEKCGKAPNLLEFPGPSRFRILGSSWMRAFLGWAYRCTFTGDPNTPTLPHEGLAQFICELYSRQGYSASKPLSECGQELPVYAAAGRSEQDQRECYFGGVTRSLSLLPAKWPIRSSPMLVKRRLIWETESNQSSTLAFVQRRCYRLGLVGLVLTPIKSVTSRMRLAIWPVGRARSTLPPCSKA